MRVVIHLSAKGFACIHKVFMQQRNAAGSALRKQVDVDKNLRRLVEQRTGVKKKRLVIEQKILIEGKTARDKFWWHCNINSVQIRGNFGY